MNHLPVLLGLLLVAIPVAAKPPAAKDVFLLHSYRPGVEWVDDQNRGIHQQLEAAGFEVQTWVDYLDSIRNPLYARDFQSRYKSAYAHRHFDLVITTDDDATQLLAANPSLFPNTPVVFGGVSDPAILSSLPRSRFTGVIEVFDDSAMLRLALRIHPNTSRIHLVTDSTPVGKYFLQSFTAHAKSAPWSLHVLNGETTSFPAIVDQLRALPPGGLVFVASMMRDSTGTYLPPSRYYPQLAASSPLPVYGLAATVGQGFLAGNEGTGVHHGQRVGRLALRVLDGESPAAIPLSPDNENLMVFDARQMARFGVASFPLPPDARPLFQQDSLIERYQAWILLAAAFAILQFLIIGGLAANVLQRRAAERALSESHAQLRAQNQQLAAAAEAKQRFVANMSHELRTPMNAILGMSELLLETPLSPPQLEFAETVRNSARSLLSLLNDVLELSRADAGRIRVELLPFDPRSLLDELLRSLQPSVAHGVSLRSSVSSDVPGFLVSDQNRVRQILLNFLFNAIKFTSAGHILVDLQPDGEGHYRFSITDTGIGIPKSQLAHVFDRFYQADDSSARAYGGSGLGLTISRELALALGGEVGATSVQGSGSTFWFRFPAASSAGLAPAPDAGPPPPPGLRVLVVEDNAVNLRLACLLLEKLGCVVHTASCGFQAIAAVQESSFDIIFMDVQMPDMDGLEATRQIRSLQLALQRTPIIALTAGVSPEDRSLCIEAGMDDHLPKPISRSQLSDTLRRFAPAPRLSLPE